MSLGAVFTLAAFVCLAVAFALTATPEEPATVKVASALFALFLFFLVNAVATVIW